MWLILYACTFGIALGLGLLFTPIGRRAALAWGLVDSPGERKPQQRPIPLFGGAAIFGALALTVALPSCLVLCATHFSACAALIPAPYAGYLPGALSVLPKLGTIGLGGLVIFLIGLWDDFRELAPRVKLLGQILVAMVMIALHVRITLFVPGFAFSAAATLIWIILITNAFNLLDNMDGLCAGVAVVASAVFFGVSAAQGHYFIAVLLAAFIGALMGFLKYNRHPASVFMGDAGSMFIGYFIAVMSILQTYYEPSAAGPLAVLMPLVILAVPLYDTLSVILIRVSHGESIFKADRRHFSHRLLALGMPVRGAAWFIYLLTLCTGLSATFLPRVGWAGGLIVFAQTALVLLVVAILEYVGECRRDNDAASG
ncbi:MAG: MraY family glycosyltransferase [Candidatus Aureabacteria bacterium]|nr:MraY family glycosyltransferase [Candidatus Auribacterota bacterium]